MEMEAIEIEVDPVGTYEYQGESVNARPSATSNAESEETYQTPCGDFGWILIGERFAPYIFINMEKYCSVRMLEVTVFNNYFQFFHPEIYTCFNIQSFHVSHAETCLFDEINTKHCDFLFGMQPFNYNDVIVRLEDALKFYNYLNMCFTKLVDGPRFNDECGFISFNRQFMVPYVLRHNDKLLPVCYFKIRLNTVMFNVHVLDEWEEKYIKFCCEVQGIQNEQFCQDACAVITLDAVQRMLPPDTTVELCWPSKESYFQFLTKGNSFSPSSSRLLRSLLE